MKKFFLIFLILTGCTKFQQLMVGPNGDTENCIAFGQGEGEACAQHMVDSCVANLKRSGYIEIEKAGFIGVKFRSDSTYILEVVPNSPAEKVGIKPGDKILEVEGQRVYLPNEAMKLLFGEHRTTVKLVSQRDAETFKRTLTRAPYIEIYGKQ